MKHSLYCLIWFFILFIAVPVSAQSTFLPEDKNDRSDMASGVSIFDNTAYINANKILMFVKNTGGFGGDENNVFGYAYGTFFPYLTNQEILEGSLISHMLYDAKLYIVGRDSASSDILGALGYYGSEYFPGPMSEGTYLPDNDDFRVYKLYADSLSGNPNYNYINWPTSQGAPVDSTGLPIMKGDQMLWTVFNGASRTGVEVQMTTWAQDEDSNDTLQTTNTLDVIQTNTQLVDVNVDVIDRPALNGHEYRVITDMDALPSPLWHLVDVTLGSTILANQTNFAGDSSASVTDGFRVRVEQLSDTIGIWHYDITDPPNLSPVSKDENTGYVGGRWFTGAGSGSLVEGGVYLGSEFGGSTLTEDQYNPVRIDFRPMLSFTDLDGDANYTVGEPYVVEAGDDDQKAFFYSTWGEGNYMGFMDIPFNAWDISDPDNPRQLAVVVRDRDQNSQWDLHAFADPPNPLLPNDGAQGWNYIWIMDNDYNPAGITYDPGAGGIDFMGDGFGDSNPTQWVLWLGKRGLGGILAEEGSLTLIPEYYSVAVDTFSFTAIPPEVLTTGPEGVSIYIEYKIYNKGTKVLKDCYVGQWSNPDVGYADGDLVGCDTLDNLYYCYNANQYDPVFGYFPPAIGFKFLAGPIIPSPGDIAVFGNNSILNHKNLGLTAFTHGYPSSSAFEIYKMMMGLKGNGPPYVYENDTLKFMSSGDPVHSVGDIDTWPGNKKTVSASGPFDLRPGDSQYVLIKMAVGQGTDNFNSITKLREILNQPFDFPTDAVDGSPSGLPIRFTLNQNYPNPFNPATTIGYSLEKRSEVNISVFNILGQKVTTLIDETKPAGNYRIYWDGNDDDGKAVATGVYLYRIAAGDFVESKKMLLLK